MSSATSFRAVEEVLNKEGEKIRKKNSALAQSSVSPIILHFNGKIVKEFTDEKELQHHRHAVFDIWTNRATGYSTSHFKYKRGAENSDHGTS